MSPLPHSLPRRPLLALAAASLAGPVRAEMAPWTIATEYPATAIPGEGVEHFAKLLTERGIPATAMANGPDGYRSAAAFSALAAGKFAATDAFAGALATTDPLFLLTSLPFLTTSSADAARLRDLARPAYEAVAEKRGATLLWTTPWPPSGLWCRHPVTTPAELKGLRLRTYDTTSTEVLRAAGADAEVLTFAEVEARLQAGTLDGVLSSGDGGTGRRLWRWLPNFVEISYAWPLSLAFAATSRLAALSAAEQATVREAAAATEARQWKAIEGRLAANQRAMRENGVQILGPSLELWAVLRGAAGPAIAAWRERAGEVGRSILTAYGA